MCLSSLLYEFVVIFREELLALFLNGHDFLSLLSEGEERKLCHTKRGKHESQIVEF